MEQPLSSEEYQYWKDTALLKGDIVGRFAATIDRFHAVNAKLLDALKASADRLHSLTDEPECQGHIFRYCPTSYCVEARAVIQEARK